jgi:CDP-diacylglycerol---serine O-phosphatidyltransferase
MKNIPNLFTLLNLVFGCMAIVSILQTQNFTFYNNEEGQWRFEGNASIPEAWWWGGLFIALAAVVDFLDGFVARFFNATSALGKQLDSLADVVSFGVAPSMIVYQMLRMGYMQQSGAVDTSQWLLFPAFIIAAAAAWRLGSFNLDESQSTYFKGVPTPAVGLMIASFPLILHKNQLGLQSYLLNPWVLYALVALVCYLMVSRHRMFSLKFSSKDKTALMPLVILAGIGIAGVFLLKWVTVPLVFFAYVGLSLLFQNKMKA